MERFDSYLGYLIRRLHQQSTALFVEQMNKHDIDLTPMQFAALNGIALNEGIDQASLAEQVACDRATMGGIIDRLEKKQLIRRVISPSDRRARALYISTEGDALLESIEPIVQDVQSKIVEKLSPEDVKTLSKLIQKAMI